MQESQEPLDPENQFRLSDEELAVKSTMFAPDFLAGKVVLIGGGGSGIGRATAWLAARLGATVIVAGRTEGKLLQVVGALSDRGLNADQLTVNIRDRESVDALITQVTEAHGPIDILVNSAGGQFPQPAIDFTVRGWQAVIDTNLNGTFNMMQAAARRWRDDGKPGSIANLVVVARGLHGVAHTVAARAGVVAFSECAAVEWAPFGIRVNCVAPGSIRSEGWAVYPEHARETYPKTNPTMRAGTPWEVAEAALYLAGPSAGFVTGETLNIDGAGRHWGEIWTSGRPSYYDPSVS